MTLLTFNMAEAQLREDVTRARDALEGAAKALKSAQEMLDLKDQIIEGQEAMIASMRSIIDLPLPQIPVLNPLPQIPVLSIPPFMGGK